MVRTVMEHSTIPPIPFLSCVPFLVLLGLIAFLPLLAPHFWEQNRNKLVASVVISLPVALYLLFTGLQHHLGHSLLYDYVPFMALLGALFVITGGISFTGDIRATPRVNTTFMAAGALLASLMGTTGAAMLLIRPLLRTNQQRAHQTHTVCFFIAIVANAGGMLTPLGDPPLLMMYLRGAPFTWFVNLWPEWLLACGLLLALYYLIDSHQYVRESPDRLLRDALDQVPLRLTGGLNLLWLLGVVLVVAFLNAEYLPGLVAHPVGRFSREGALLVLALLSWLLTPRAVRQENRFTFGPILEVAVLFFGIFVTMVPCLLFLEQHAQELGLTEPWQFYYVAGTLSSILDNTPTAVTFHSLARGLAQQGGVLVAGIPEPLLRAICTGAVFFGAMTYIGNGPNFMIKAVAEESGIRMPSFFGYLFRFSLLVLLPIFILIQLLLI